MERYRRVRIFKNGSNQAIRIPRELELNASEAMIHKEGNRLVIEPVERSSLLEVLATWKPLDLSFPDLPDPAPQAIEL
jgi:antitoxin VapB